MVDSHLAAHPAGRKPLACNPGLPVTLRLSPLPSRNQDTVPVIYSFDVTVSTHDLLRVGVTAARLYGSPERHHRIVVGADSRNEASLIAAQMASHHGMWTGVYDRI